MILGKQRAGIRAHVLGNEAVLHNKEGKKVHVLNPTAHAIWKCCDGMQTLDDALTTLANEFEGVDEASLRLDILETVATLRSKDLIE